MRRRVNHLLVLLMIAAMLIVGALPTAAAPPPGATAVQPAAKKVPNFSEATAVPASSGGVVLQPKNAKGPATYLVRLADPPLASYRGGIPGLAPTSPAVTGARKLNVKSPASLAYRQYLADKQASLVNSIEQALGHPAKVLYHYYTVYNGVAVRLTPEEAPKVAALPGVISVQREQWRYPLTDVTPQFIGATSIWDGTATGGLPGTKGEGVIVGVIDTGIWPEHPSFADDGTYPPPPPEWGGECTPPADDTPGYTCNNKLIGVQYFLDSYIAAVGGYDGLFNSGRDDDGHGTHTASTAAGNENVPVTLLGVDRGTVSGIAPRAHVAMYKGLGPQGGTTADLVAAIDKAVADGVDVINYSIGGGTSDPWTDADAQAFLAARDAGVFVATSAGNSGPDPSTLGSPGDAPWITTVGASTSNRHFISEITLNGPGEPPTGLFGASVTAGVTDFNLVDAEGIPDSEGDDSGMCLNPFNPGTFQPNDVVLCRRGQIARVLRGDYVAAGGGGGVILYNPVQQGITTDNFVIPGVHVENDVGQAIKDYVTQYPGQVTVSFTQGTATFGPDDPRVIPDMMASFSSRGPTVQAASNYIKPDVTAPGVQILAGNSPENYEPGAQGELFQAIQGTSMSSPHVAGAAALLKALHPDWTPGEIQSALMTTAKEEGVVKEDGVTPADPFDFGAGRIDLTRAGMAGLAFDETTANFEDADPAAGGDPRTLNLPSMANSTCVGQCGWERTVQSTLDSDMDWTATLALPEGITGTVVPTDFTLPAGGTQVLTVTVDVSGVAPDQWYFGELVLSPVTDSIPSAHVPIAVMPTTGEVPGQVDIYTRRDAGSYPVPDVTAIEISDLTVENFGLAKGTQYDLSLAQDPTNGDPYDNLDDVWWMTFNVITGTSRMVAEVVDSTAPDIDLYWGWGTTPSPDTELGSSTTSSFIEYLNADDPPPGDYWVLVQTWAGSGAPADDITFVLGVVDGDAGNMAVQGPAAVPALQPFDLRVFWNQAMTAGEIWYGAFTLGTDSAHVGNIARVDVDLHRLEDDVTKTADKVEALPGDVVMYTIQVQPNVLPEDLTYTITDTLPAGMTYVPGSAVASSGEVTVDGNTIVWTGTMPTPLGARGGYVMTTSADDPMCDTGFGGYVNLEDFGIFANPNITGDTVAFTAFTSGDPINYYGDNYTGMSFTDDGFAIFDVNTNYGGAPWVPQTVPDPALPNNVLAAFWQDLEIFYDQAQNHGVSLATAGAPGGLVLVEYDDVQFWGGSADTFDFEIIVSRAVDNTPGAYEIVYAFDNLNGDLSGPLTIGVENAAGDDAVALVNNDSAEGVLSNGFMVCFDYVGPMFDPVFISYEAQVGYGVEPGTELTNMAVHNTDNPGSQAAEVSTTVTVLQPPEPTIMRSRRFDVVRDTFVDGTRPGAYFGDASTMWVGMFDQMRPVVHVPITGIPPSAAVDKAYLYLYVVEGRGYTAWPGSVIPHVTAHGVTTEWLPYPVNWTSPWSNPGGDITAALDGTHIGSGKVGTWVRFDVTDYVQRIVRHEIPNYGFMITSDDTNGVRYGFATKEYWDPGKVGYLRVMYRTLTALDNAEQ